MQNLEEFKTENWSTDASGPAFIVRATIKGLELLAGILVIAREVRDALREIQDMQSCQEQPLIPEEAMQILRISKTGNVLIYVS